MSMLVSPIAVLSLLAIATVAAAPSVAAERYQCYDRSTARCAAKYACEGRHAWSELLHQFQQMQVFLLEDLPT